MHLKSLHNSSTVCEFKNIFDAASNIDDTYTSILIVSCAEFDSKCIFGIKYSTRLVFFHNQHSDL